MNKYEIMLILGPKSEPEIAEKLIKETFSQKPISFEKMERTDLAYEIHKSETAQYFLALIEIDPQSNELDEFTRKIRIIKGIWRHLIINLSNERGFYKSATPQRPRSNDRFGSRGRFGDNRGGPRREGGGYNRGSGGGGYNRGPRPEGGGGYNRGPRPEGGGYNRGPRPEGGGYNRGPRPEGGGYNRGPRPEGGGGFNRGGPRKTFDNKAEGVAKRPSSTYSRKDSENKDASVKPQASEDSK